MRSGHLARRPVYCGRRSETLNTIQHRNLTIRVGLAGYCLAAALLNPLSARAEGPRVFDGAWGVNRVVRTKSNGFTQARGIFTIEGFGVPGVERRNSNGKIVRVVTSAANRKTSRPNPYLGGSAVGHDGSIRHEVDAGVEYEWRTRPARVPNPRHRQDPKAPRFIQVRPIAGWAPFITVSHIFDGMDPWVSPRVVAFSDEKHPLRDASGAPILDAHGHSTKVWLPFRIPDTRAGRIIGLKYRLWGAPQGPNDPPAGSVSLVVNGHEFFWIDKRTYNEVMDQGALPDPSSLPVGTIWPDREAVRRAVSLGRPSAPMDPARFASSDVKRCIAMTQAQPYKGAVDGSFLRIRFSDGAVRRYDSQDWIPWTAQIVDQSATGYDDARMTENTPREPAVQFPDNDDPALARKPGSGSAPVGGASRYEQETVVIRLTGEEEGETEDEA